MGKKNKAARKKLTKNKFKQTYCSKCRLCSNHNPSFCFNKLYKASPVKFIEHIFPNLMQHNEMLKAQVIPNLPGDTLLTSAFFRNVICSSGACGKCGKNIKEGTIAACAEKFRCQSVPKYMSVGTIRQQSKKDRRKARKAEVAKIKASTKVTVLMSDDPSFREAVDRILGNNYQQQNQTH